MFPIQIMIGAEIAGAQEQICDRTRWALIEQCGDGTAGQNTVDTFSDIQSILSNSTSKNSGKIMKRKYLVTVAWPALAEGVMLTDLESCGRGFDDIVPHPNEKVELRRATV